MTHVIKFITNSDNILTIYKLLGRQEIQPDIDITTSRGTGCKENQKQQW